MRTGEMSDDDADAGFTLIEMMVAMSLMVVLMLLTIQVVGTTGSAVKLTTDQQGLNEEARQAINRMARDLRQATSVVTAVNPDGPSYSATGVVAVRARADFDGDGCIGGTGGSGCLVYNASNPEDVTYCFLPAARQLYVIDNQAPGVTPVSSTSTTCAGGQPLLAGNVQTFLVEYRSNQYRYDTGPTDGVTTWRELDAAGAPVGNDNDALDAELANIDSVVLNVTMKIGSKSQQYRTQVSLRNRS